MKTWQLIFALCLVGQSVMAGEIHLTQDTESNSIYNFLKNLWNSGGSKDTSKYYHPAGLVTQCPPNVMFVLDASDSVSPTGFEAAKVSLIREIRAVVQAFANTHVGVIYFSNVVEVSELKARNATEIQALITQIQNFKQPRKSTALSKAFETARELLLEYSVIETRAYNGMQSGSIIVFLTDGYTDSKTNTIQEAKQAKSSNMLVISLTIGTADLTLLKSISHLVQNHTQSIDWGSQVACPSTIREPIERLKQCRDILLVVDGSDSVLIQKETVRQYLAYTALRYRYVTNAIGVNIYGTNSQVQASNTRIRLMEDKYTLADLIRIKLQFPTSGGTGTNHAVTQSVEMLNDDLRDKPSALVLITDGPTLDQQATRDAIQAARISGYLVIIIRVGKDLTDTELNYIAGNDMTNVLSVDTFTQLFGLNFDDRVCNDTDRTNCLPCPASAVLLNDCSCQCPVGQQFNSVTRTCYCTNSCPTGASRNSDCSCNCPGGQIYNAATGLCNCPSGQTYNTATGQCVAVCSIMCPSTAFVNSTCNCQCYNSNQRYNSFRNQCECPVLCHSSASQNVDCTCSCINGQIMNPTTGACVCSRTCPNNAFVSSDCSTCLCNDGNRRYNSATNLCECLQLCPAFATQDTSCSCICPTGQSFNSATRQCVCSGGQILNPATGQCNCPTGQTYNAFTGLCSCPSGQTVNPVTGLCDCLTQCPTNSVRINNCGCQCSQPNYNYNSITNQCDPPLCQPCPSNAVAGAGCSCTCPVGTVYNSFMNTCDVCSCPPNAIVGPGCSCTCPNGQYYDTNTRTCETAQKVCNITELACENGQLAYRDCSGRCFCDCSAAYAGLRCEIIVQANLCDGCFYNNGHYTAGVNGYCDLYVNCVPSGGIPTNSSVRPSSFVPYVMHCPPGTFYVTRDDGWQGCDFLDNGRCTSDQCPNLAASARYTDYSSCQSYWQCGASKRLTTRGCCPVGQRFDPSTFSCIVDSSCQPTCGVNFTSSCGGSNTTVEPGCPFAVNPINPNEYYHKAAPGSPYKCLPNMIMDVRVCLCVQAPTATPTACQPTINLTFEQQLLGVENNVPRVIAGGSYAGNFSGSDDIILKAFAGSGFWTDYFQINLRLFLPRPVPGGGRMAVVTNADCNTQESVSITMDNQNIYFRIIQIDSNETVEIAIPYDPSRANSDGSYSITLVYRRVSGGFEFSGTVGSFTVVYRGSVALTSNIAMRTCAVHVGQGYLYNGLVGYADDVQIWRCDPKTSTQG